MDSHEELILCSPRLHPRAVERAGGTSLIPGVCSSVLSPFCNATAVDGYRFGAGGAVWRWRRKGATGDAPLLARRGLKHPVYGIRRPGTGCDPPEPDDAAEDEADAEEPHDRRRLVEQDDAGDHRARRSDPVQIA